MSEIKNYKEETTNISMCMVPKNEYINASNTMYRFEQIINKYFSILEVLDSDAIDIGSNEKMCYLRRKGLELLEAKNSDQKISSRRIQCSIPS